MNLEIDKAYLDRGGCTWIVLSIDTSPFAPVTAGRWKGKSYLTRTFQLDGRYWVNRDDPWDLIEAADPREEL